MWIRGKSETQVVFYFSTGRGKRETSLRTVGGNYFLLVTLNFNESTILSLFLRKLALNTFAVYQWNRNQLENCLSVCKCHLNHFTATDQIIILKFSITRALFSSIPSAKRHICTTSSSAYKTTGILPVSLQTQIPFKSIFPPYWSVKRYRVPIISKQCKVFIHIYCDALCNQKTLAGSKYKPVPFLISITDSKLN